MQTELIVTATQPCPESHAYAADKGAFCCKYPRKIANTSIHAK